MKVVGYYFMLLGEVLRHVLVRKAEQCQRRSPAQPPFSQEHPGGEGGVLRPTSRLSLHLFIVREGGRSQQQCYLYFQGRAPGSEGVDPLEDNRRHSLRFRVFAREWHHS